MHGRPICPGAAEVLSQGTELEPEVWEGRRGIVDMGATAKAAAAGKSIDPAVLSHPINWTLP